MYLTSNWAWVVYQFYTQGGRKSRMKGFMQREMAFLVNTLMSEGKPTPWTTL